MRIVGFLFLPLLSAAFASAQGETGMAPIFAHDALSCMSTDDFPIVEAVFESAEFGALRKAQVYFKAGDSDAWYFVDMEPSEQSKLQAMLPKPLADTERVDYYLFFLSGTFEPAQSEEFSVRVSDGCAMRREVASTPASLTLHATVVNQPPIPPGFQPTGISSLVTTAGNSVAVGSAVGGASGGISGATVGIIAGGGAAAATGVAVASGGSESDAPTTTTGSPDPNPTSDGGSPTSSTPGPEPTPSPDPTPAPPPAPSQPDVSGVWTINYRIVGSCDPSLIGRTSTTPLEMQQNGTAVSATRNGPNFTENLNGTIDMAGNIALRGSFVDESDTGEARIEAKTTDGTDISGRYIRIYPAYGNCTVRWTMNGEKN